MSGDNEQIKLGGFSELRDRIITKGLRLRMYEVTLFRGKYGDPVLVQYSKEIPDGYTYFGRIDSSGMFWPSMRLRESPREIKRQVWSMMTHLRLDIDKTITNYGRKTQTCAICNTPLTNPESKARGIGPVCASKYGIT